VVSAILFMSSSLRFLRFLGFKEVPLDLQILATDSSRTASGWLQPARSAQLALRFEHNGECSRWAGHPLLERGKCSLSPLDHFLFREYGRDHGGGQELQRAHERDGKPGAGEPAGEYRFIEHCLYLHPEREWPLGKPPGERGGGEQPTAFTASSTTVGTQGGTITIGWQGSTSPTLTISSSGSTSGITVNGVPYSGPTILSGSFAVLSFPPTSQYGGAPTYTLSLAAGGVTKTLSLIQEVAPILAVANEGNSTVTIYALSGITSSSGPALTLNTGSVTSPTALAFDQEGNLWVGGATCPSILLEFQAPLTLNETPKTFNAGSNAYSLAFDAQGNLWVGGNSCQNGGGTIQEEKMTSSGLSQVTSLSPGATPLGLAFDQQGDLWVGLVGNGSTQILEYQTPLSSSSTPKTYPLQSNSGGFGPIAFDTSGNLYSFVQSNPAPLEELPAGSSSFTQLFSVTTPGILFLPTSLAFDQEGNLWVSDLNSKLALIQVLSGLCAGST